MFYYFGRKKRLAPMYPDPVGNLIIEPFAGSMAFTLHHQPALAIGTEIDPTVHAVWTNVCSVSVDELAAWPEPEHGSRTTDRWAMMAVGTTNKRTIEMVWCNQPEALRRAA